MRSKLISNKLFGATIAVVLYAKIFAMTFVLLIYDLKVQRINTSTEFADSDILTHHPNAEVHSKIKNAMIAKGYANTAHTTQTQLPHNCFVKDNTSQQQAILDLIEVVKNHDTALANYMAVTVNGSYQADASLL